MDDSSADHHHDSSDYGSDFASDEEEILSQLLRKPLASTNPGLELSPFELEGDQYSRSARFAHGSCTVTPRGSGSSIWNLLQSKKKISVEIEDYEGSATTRRFYPRSRVAQLTDGEAFSGIRPKPGRTRKQRFGRDLLQACDGAKCPGPKVPFGAFSN